MSVSLKKTSVAAMYNEWPVSEWILDDRRWSLLVESLPGHTEGLYDNDLKTLQSLLRIATRSI